MPVPAGLGGAIPVTLDSGPCNWNVEGSCCDDIWAAASGDLQQAAAEYGAFVMWAATGRRYGACERTVRPCGRQCQSCAQGWYWSDGAFIPYLFNGEWRNCWCGNSAGCCTCEPRCQVFLPGPVASIPASGVSVDGEIIPAGSWRVDNGQWLVRTDGECWPECQDFNENNGAENTFQVVYNKGLAVPSLIERAAGQLACEWIKACQGLPCRLPQRVQSVVRQGVTISMVDVDTVLGKGWTGITEVDQIIAMDNPYGLKSRMKISSPDDPVIKITTLGG